MPLTDLLDRDAVFTLRMAIASCLLAGTAPVHLVEGGHMGREGFKTRDPDDRE